MIEIRNATKAYDDVVALDDVSMRVEEGSAVGLVGTNGAGKTTLFRLLVGHATPDSGSVRVAGIAPTAGPELRERVGFVPEDASFDPRLTGREVLELHARLRGVSRDARDERVERVLATVGLPAVADRAIVGYSNGLTQRLAVGTALVRRPDVLLLDEPTAALDPQGVDAFHAVVDRVRERTNVTLVVTSHVLDEVERLCDRVVVLDDGRVKARGGVAEVTAVAGDDVTVRVTPAQPEDRVVMRAGALDAVEDVSTVVRGDDLVVTCPRDVAFDVLDAIRDAGDVASFEVTEPGLADAFDAVVAGDDASTDDAVATDGGERA